MDLFMSPVTEGVQVVLDLEPQLGLKLLSLCKVFVKGIMLDFSTFFAMVIATFFCHGH